MDYKISVIIPTIWSTDYIYESVEIMSKIDIIDEIIIINNRPSACKRKLEFDKVKEFSFDENLYVNAAWNFGVYKSKNEKICILNDDVLIDSLAFYYALFLLDDIKIGVIGISKICFIGATDYKVEKIETRNRGYGTVMFLRKSEYVPIPEDLKIWFGDDWIIKNNVDRVYRMSGPFVKTIMSSTSSSEEFTQIINNDVSNSIKYQLPWSNDYE